MSTKGQIVISNYPSYKIMKWNLLMKQLLLSLNKANSGVPNSLESEISHFKPLQRIKLHFGSEGMRQQGTHFIDNFFCFMNIEVLHLLW